MDNPLPRKDTATAGHDAAPANTETSDSPEDKSSSRKLTLSLRIDARILAALLVLSLVGNGALGWLWYQDHQVASTAQTQVATMREDSADRQHAEQVALDYATQAAVMDYTDMAGWTKRLVGQTSPELAKKLKDASAAMEQIVVPLQWKSTAAPIAAVVRSSHDGVFVVNAFVSVTTKNLQAPEGVLSTATYTVTTNKKDNWVITDVGGLGSAIKAGR
ncbi:hypothetical protein BOO86_21755 [Mycobacterium sp. CBMA 234]|nr:hypothetical protein [Mycolicibacterium sp. CBMA 234]